MMQLVCLDAEQWVGGACWLVQHSKSSGIKSIGARGGTFKSRVCDKSVGGSKLKLRRLAQHADREPEEDDIMAHIV